MEGQNVVSFGIPSGLKRYEIPLNIFEDISSGEISISVGDSLGAINKMISDHQYLVLNWLENSDFLKPYSDWSELTKSIIDEQRIYFNEELKEYEGASATLLCGEEVKINRARFLIRDIEDDYQELARIVGVVSEVLFLELAVYSPSRLQWLLVEDFQVKKIEK